jgi:Tfp pilus assembly protein PilF
MFKVKKLVWVMSCVSVLGGCAMHQSRDKQAVNIKPLLDGKHTGTDAMYWLGRYHQSRANYTEAIEAYERALTENPRSAETHNGLGVCYFLQGQRELAWQHLQKAIALSPAASHLHHNLGYAYLLQGRDRNAAAAFEQALRLDAGNRQARRKLALLYKKMGLPGKTAILSATGGGAATLAVAIESAPEPVLVPYGLTFRPAEGRRAQGAPSTSIPINLIPIRGDGKVLQEHGPLLVQITPDVFELRMKEADWKMTDYASKTVRGRAPSAAGRDAGAPPGRTGVSIEISKGNGAPGTARNQIKRLVPNPAQMAERPSLLPDIQVRMVLSKDLAREGAYFDQGRRIQLAQGALQAADMTQGRELRLKISTKISTGHMSNSR